MGQSNLFDNFTSYLHKVRPFLSFKSLGSIKQYNKSLTAINSQSNNLSVFMYYNSLN